jgi:hypothetical protein
MSSKVKGSAAELQPEVSLEDMDVWGATHLDAEILDGAVRSLKSEQEAVKKT